jgi:putative mRNA 3-end processing factor
VNAQSKLDVAVDEAGLYLRALGLWLDPVRPARAAFVSHAHATQAMASGSVLASRETLALAEALGAPSSGSARAMDWNEPIEFPIDAAFGGGHARLSIAPAGHVLGAAQLVVEAAGTRLVYTGDFSADQDATHPRGEPVPCDELVMTSTFALPIFRFDPHGLAVAGVADWCAARLAAGLSPVVLAQNPGPAQSIARELHARGVPVAATDDVRRVAAAYEGLGVSIGPLLAFEAGVRDVALVAAAGARAAELRPGGRRKRAEIAYASGWALLDAAVEQKRADAAFAVADHADHDCLVALVKSCGARVVHVSRGDARAFAHMLRGAGVHAEAIELYPIDERGAS